MTAKASTSSISTLRIGVVVPHIFMQDTLLSDVIFSPGPLALQLCDGLRRLGHDVTIYTPGAVETSVRNIVSDSTLFERELKGRGDAQIDLLKKHPFTFVTLARQLQSEIISKAYQDANDDKLDIVHVYTNEEELALSFANLCNKPVVFTHHDPFNFLIKYKNNFPKYSHLNWISLSEAQRAGMPSDTNWVANIYHGFDDDVFKPTDKPVGDYVLFLGRIIQPKGLHLAVQAVQRHNQTNPEKSITLKIAGKHYGDDSNDSYWNEQIEPALADPHIEYLGFIKHSSDKASLLANAKALIMPSLFDEPFGMVAIESLACGTPVIGLNSGAIPEIISDRRTGLIASKVYLGDGALDSNAVADSLATYIAAIGTVSRHRCRTEYESRFTTERMSKDYSTAYVEIIESQDQS